MDPTHLSDADLEAELRMRASSRHCELSVERDGSHWRAAFKQFSDEPEIAPLGVVLVSVDAPDRRWALERLLWLAEDRTEVRHVAGNGSRLHTPSRGWPATAVATPVHQAFMSRV